MRVLSPAVRRRRLHSGAPLLAHPGVLPAALALILVGLCHARPATAAESWSVAEGQVRVRCRMTVGGSFDAVTSTLSGTLRRTTQQTGSYAGAIQVDLATLDTGIALRNAHLRDRYLMIERGPAFRRAVLSGIEIETPPTARGGRHRTRFSGALTLHGVQRAVTGEAELRQRDGRLQVDAEFSLSLNAFDIPPPRYLGIGVRDTLEVTVRFEAASGEPSADDRR